MANKRIAAAQQEAPKDANSDSELIDAIISALADWRGETLARVRKLIHEADTEVVEEIKWRKPSNPSGVPVWSHAGMLCTGETYTDKVKLTFAKGASLLDPAGLFNASLDGNARRAIDIRDGDQIDGNALSALIRAAVALNTTRRRGSPSAPFGNSSRERCRFYGLSTGFCGWRNKKPLNTLFLRRMAE
jgi:hypothetical protein